MDIYLIMLCIMVIWQTRTTKLSRPEDGHFVSTDNTPNKKPHVEITWIVNYFIRWMWKAMHVHFEPARVY